jgi:hypothetical protein
MSSYTNTNGQFNNRTAPKRRIKRFDDDTNDQEGVFALGEQSQTTVGHTPVVPD